MADLRISPWSSQPSPWSAQPTGRQPSRRQPSALSGWEDPTQEETDSLLQSLGNISLGGLSFVGNILDTPGSLVRGVLAGRNPLPGIFDPSQRVSGRDVLETYGLLGKNADGFHPFDNPSDALGDVAGFATEVFTDPTSVLLMGPTAALSKSGAVAAKLGAIPKATYAGASMAQKTGLRKIGARLFNKPLEESTRILKTGAREALMTETFSDAIQRMNSNRLLSAPAIKLDAIDAAAKQYGTTAAELLASDKPLGYLAGVGNPFSRNPAWFGFGKDTPFIGDHLLGAAKYLDKAQDAARYSLPGRIAAQIFSKPAGNAISKPGQLVGQKVYDDGVKATEAVLGLRSQIETELKKLGLPADVEHDLLFSGLEIPNPTGLPTSSLLTPAEQALIAHDPGAFDRAISLFNKQDASHDAAKVIGLYRQDLRQRVPGVGAPAGQPGALPPMPAHTARFADIPDNYGSAGRGKQMFNLKADSALARSDELYDVRANTIDSLAMDKNYMSLARAAAKASEDVEYAARRVRELTDPAQVAAAQGEYQAAQRAAQQAWQRSDAVVMQRLGRTTADVDVWKNNLKNLEEGLAFLKSQGQPLPLLELRQVSEYKRLISQHRRIGETLSGLPEEAAGKRFYIHPLDSFTRSVEQNMKSTAMAEELMRFAADFSVPGGKGVPLYDVLHGTKFAKGASPDITDEATAQMISLLTGTPGGHGYDIPKIKNDLGPITSDSDILRHFTLPEDIAGDMKRLVTGFKDPEALKPALEVFDWMTAKFKTGVTSPWPSFFNRNFVQGAWQNTVIGAARKRWYEEAHNLISGGKPTAALLEIPLVRNAGITNVDEAAEFMRRAFHQYNVTGQSFLDDATGKYKPIIENVRGHVVGEPGNIQSLTGALKAFPGEANPLTKTGIWDKVSSIPRAAVRAGERANTYSESLHRSAGFMALLEQGFDPSVAAAKIRQAHVDYADLSDVEKVVFRRIMPFYAWSRKMTPAVLDEITSRPGGFSGQLAQFSAYSRGQDEGFLPDYLQGGLGMKVGEADENGKQTFLTNLDLAPESVFEPLSYGPNMATETGLKVLGMTNPLIKAPLEAMTGRQFFTNRDMRDLHSTLGLPPLLEQVISNSPLARVKSTASQLQQMATGRKNPLYGAANLLTGLRFTDVDIPKHKSIKTRELIQDEMRREAGLGVFEKMYTPVEFVQDLIVRAKAGDQKAIRQLGLLKIMDAEQKSVAARRKAENAAKAKAGK